MTDTADVDYYEVLGVASDASESDIKKAYIRMCRKFHPDKATSEEEAREFTVRMFQINDAKEILMDAEKRREYHRLRKENRKEAEQQRASEQGKAYNNREDFSNRYNADEERRRQYSRNGRRQHNDKPKAKSGGIGGSTYKGQFKAHAFVYEGNGRHGSDADRGNPGRNGYSFGMDGGKGSNAGPAENGRRGTDWKIYMKTVIHTQGYFEVVVDGLLGGELLDPKRDVLRKVPLKSFQYVDWSACGGRGGRGGCGGNGGDGYRGYSGKDATRWSVGTDGGPGGDGGDGGLGTNGGDGGRGGFVEVQLHKGDIYLLMRLKGCHPRTRATSRIAGGAGGEAGQHGRGGAGGAGGRGGSSYSWTTTSYYTDSNGNQQTIHDYHRNAGGWDGKRGNPGCTPSSPLYHGEEGSEGTFVIRVIAADKTSTMHDARYNLEFRKTETNQLSDMKDSKTYEFGEHVIINSCQIENTGAMESPAHRVLVRFYASKYVKTESSDRLFLARGSTIFPGGRGSAKEGYLRFSCPYPMVMEKGEDFEPILQKAWIRYQAHQLGPENMTDSPLLSDFEERYDDFHDVLTGEELKIRYPIENQNGVRGLRSLAPQETTFVRLTLSNVSNQSLGRVSVTERIVFVQFYFSGEDGIHGISIEKIQVRGESGNVVNINPARLHNGKQGYREEVPYIAGNRESTLQVSLKLASKEVPVAARAALQMDVYIQKIPRLKADGTHEAEGKKRLIQRRKFVISCQPKFEPHKDSDVIIVTSTASNPRQVEAWESVVKNTLRLTPKVYSLSRYGHIDAGQISEDVLIGEAFKANLVVILNDDCIVQPNNSDARKIECTPSRLLNSVFDFEESTRFLVVGGNCEAVQHLSPQLTGFSTVVNHNSELLPVVRSEKVNQKSYRQDFASALEKERSTGFSIGRQIPFCDTVSIKIKQLGKKQPSQKKIEKILERRSTALKKHLQVDKLRPHTVEPWSLGSGPIRIEKKGVRSTWKVGELRVSTGPPRFQNTLVCVDDTASPTKAFATVESVSSLPMLYAVVDALDFEVKMKCFATSIRGLSMDRHTSRNKDVITVVIDSLLKQFNFDVSNYAHGKMKVKDPAKRSFCVRALLDSRSMREIIEEALVNDTDELQKRLSEHLTSIVAVLKCVANSKDLFPWWNPASQKHRVRRAMTETVGLLETAWKHFLDDKMCNKTMKSIKQLAKQYIKKDRKKILLRCRGRWRAALVDIHSPRNEKRYAPALGFASPTSRVCHQSQLGLSRNTTKVKKFFPETVKPSEAKAARSRTKNRQDYSTAILTTTVGDIEEYQVKDFRKHE